MIFEWLRRHRRRRLLERPFPRAWLAVLNARVPYYARLEPEEQAALRDDLRVFLAEKRWEGCGGLTLTDEMRVAIAAQAAYIALRLPHRHYPNVRCVLVYPAGYWAPDREVGPDGVVTVGRDHRAGEAWEHGVVILSWRDVRASARDPGDGYNVVFHECAHQLDMLDGRADGFPPLPDAAAGERWAEVMEGARAALARRVGRRRAGVLDPYGAGDAAEFFAVATEAFFERPEAVREEHPALYAVLRDYYGRDPLPGPAA